MKFFLLMGVSISLIIWVIQAVNFLDFVTEDGHSLYVYFLYTLHNLPKIIHRVLPFIFFISLFYQINQYEIKNELLIFWTIGINKLYFLKIILLFSLFFSIFQIFLGAYVSPVTQDKARSYVRDSNIDFFPSLIQPGKFIDTVKNLTIFIMSEKLPGNYENIFLKEVLTSNPSIKSEKYKIVYAKKGYLRVNGSKKYLELIDGRVLNKDASKINNFSFTRIDFDLMKYTSKSTSFPKISELNSYLLIKCLNYYSRGIADQLISRILSCNESSVKDIKEEIFKRFYKPIYIPLLALLACLIIFTSSESKRYTFYKTTIFFLGIFVIVISEVSLRYTSESSTGVYFFIIFPLFLFLSICFYLIKNLNINYK
jgi:lipopolysaccharide export system permease protein